MDSKSKYLDSFGCKRALKVGNKAYEFYDLEALPSKYDIEKFPYSIKILLENLLRNEDGVSVTKQQIESILNWDPTKPAAEEISFTPSRVILQDFTGVPAIVDLATMREAVKDLGKNPSLINPLSPVELVIDHSVIVDHYGDKHSFAKNVEKEYERNNERYKFLRWGQNAFDNFKVVPPGTGIVHQVNIEYLARVVFQSQSRDDDQVKLLYPDTVVGTDSHTTMINGLGVLGWGVGGIEAEAAMLGQPISMLIPEVVGVRLLGNLSEVATATDLVLVVVEKLRELGVVGKFVEFFGEGLQNLPLADRGTIANMAPEYGATCGIFPIDDVALEYLKFTGRDEEHLKLVEAYSKAQGLYRPHNAYIEAKYTTVLEVDLASVEPCIAGPSRPQDRIELSQSKDSFKSLMKQQGKDMGRTVPLKMKGTSDKMHNGDVVIAAITSCTNTSNPELMLTAGILAKNANEQGLKVKPWVKTSLAPGSQVVTDYFDKSNVTESLAHLGFNIVGYGCTTCIGNSGPLAEPVSEAIKEGELSVCAVLSGNRNFEGRVHPEVSNAYLASPPLVVAYALAGNMHVDFDKDPLGTSPSGEKIYLRDIWPSKLEVSKILDNSLDSNMFTERYKSVFDGDKRWQTLEVPDSELFSWEDESTYIRKPGYFDGLTMEQMPLEDINDARVLLWLGDSVTTDHISPAGSFTRETPAGKYLMDKGTDPLDFNSYGSRRGNHEVMMRGTFANIRMQNKLSPDKKGGFTTYHQDGSLQTVFDAAKLYQQDNIPLIVIAGKEYGTGSSRDWAAKGTKLLGVKAVIAESFERIHRSNLVGMGVLPLQFKPGENADSLGLDATESFSISLQNIEPRGELEVSVKSSTSGEKTFNVLVRIDTPKELEYMQNGGILSYVLKNLVA